jgi:Ca-activated chloride channel family protein
VDPHLLRHLVDAAGGAPQRPWARWSGLLAAALVLVALAGPSVRKVELPLWQSKAPLVVVLDLSSATLARDLPPSRLAQARAKIATLLRERAGGQVALVAFAEDAYTVAPLTEDAANIALFLDALAPDVMPEDGHRADRAIALSQRLLRNAGFDHGDILLLTDRADAQAIAEAARARTAGYRVSVLGLGTARGGVFETPAGLRDARLDAGSLQALVASGGGAYRPLAAGDADLRALGVLDPQVGDGAAARGEKIASRRDDGYWLLPLAMLLALPLFRRGRATAAMLALALCLPMPPAQAQDANGWWRRADQQAHARMLEGIAAYRRQQYEEAIGKFTGNPTAVGQYNLGNALAKAGRYDEAIAAYDRALKQQPAMQDAVANRAAVDAARKRKPPPGGQQQNPGGQPSKGQQGKQGDTQGQPQPPQPSPEASPQDAQQQARADAAQRQRMQDALRKQQQPQQPGQGQPQPARKETAEQRERRIANQAQLQRVPDDPGALLRTKFRLEHERREGGRQ